MPFPFPPEDKPWPYQLLGQRPFEPPTLFGVPTITEYYRLTEENFSANAISPGDKIQFARNAVVTGMHFTQNPMPYSQGITERIQITKSGKETVFTNGVEPVRISPSIFTWGTDTLAPVFIPVDAGEIWKSDILTSQQSTCDYYNILIRAERLAYKPDKIPEWLPSTLFYTAYGTIPAASVSNAEEIDFREDSIVTGFRATSTHSAPNQVELSILLEGERNLIQGYQVGHYFDMMGINAPWGTRGPNLWIPVNRREKWQVTPRNKSLAERLWAVIFRAEERRRPWERW